MADSGRCSLIAGQAARASSRVFFLLSGSDLNPGPGICAAQTAAAREREVRLERVCGIS
jgi:hypothetical protein